MKNAIQINKIIFFVLFLAVQCTFAQKAVTIVPVADLVGKPQCRLHPHKKTSLLYRSFPEFDSEFTCPRLHQLLFNEVVDVIESQRDEVKVRIPNLFCITTADHKTKNAEFWTEKQNIVLLDTLRKKNITPDIFPASIDFKQQAITSRNKNTATLIMPFHDPATKQTFSAGTRFVRTGKQTKNTVEAFIFDAKAHQVKKSFIPKSLCFIEKGQSKKERVQAFLSILKRWAHLSDGYIPYVWGGCSFTQPEKKAFKHHVQTKNNKKTTIYTYHSKDSIKKGLDCSGLIARAAQICGIPYFFKNSTTILYNLKDLAPGKNIEAGDIIWFRGHVLIVSDVQKNLIIEARGYQGGYGRIHEVGLNKVFKEIKTCHGLAQAMHKKQKLTIVGKDGKETSKVDHIKILKLSSAWQLK